MNKLEKLFKVIFIGLFLVTAVACSDDDDGNMAPASNTIADFVVANQANYSLLLEALQKADGNLVATLSGPGPFTVFAPDNAAFTAFLSANGFADIDAVPTDVLSQILLNHVVSGSVQSSQLSTGYINTLATASPISAAMSMYVDLSSGVKLNGVSNVTGADNIVDNGVVHLVDGVIGLPTVVTFATADPTFSTLVAALTDSRLTTDFVATLSTPDGTDPAPFTVFAPTDNAFTDLLAELNAGGLGDIDEPTLNATLTYHVVGGANVLDSDLADDLTVMTLGGDITANITGGATLTDANERVSDIIATNVQAANGVIHVINKVILPPL